MKLMRKDAIKNVSEVLINEGNVLAKVHEKKSNILVVKSLEDQANPTEESFDYAEIVALGPNVEGLDIGDIIIDFNNGIGILINKIPYLLIHRVAINIAVKPNNIDLSEDLQS